MLPFSRWLGNFYFFSLVLFFKENAESWDEAKSLEVAKPLGKRGDFQNGWSSSVPALSVLLVCFVCLFCLFFVCVCCVFLCVFSAELGPGTITIWLIIVESCRREPPVSGELSRSISHTLLRDIYLRFCMVHLCFDIHIYIYFPYQSCMFSRPT